MPSDYINRKSAENILKAFDYAKYIDKPLNQFVVCRMADAHFDQADALFRKIRLKCRSWLQRRQAKNGLPVESPVYTYSFENPESGGLHVNWVIHIPDEFQTEFRSKLPGWVTKALGSPVEARDIHVQDVDPFSDKRLANYILKGVDPAYIDYLHLRKIAAPQGPISGRRSGASLSINREARSQSGFIPRLQRNEWKTRDWAQRR